MVTTADTAVGLITTTAAADAAVVVFVDDNFHIKVT